MKKKYISKSLKAVVAIAVALAFIIPGSSAIVDFGAIDNEQVFVNNDVFEGDFEIILDADGEIVDGSVGRRSLIMTGFLDDYTMIDDQVESDNTPPLLLTGVTIYVDDDGGADYTTIQEGVDAANPGDTVFVYNGVYYEHVSIGKSISLVGESRAGAIIDGSGTGTVVYVTSSNVNIDSFTVRYGEYGILLEGVSYSTVMNCDSHGHSHYAPEENFFGGIMLVSSSFCTIMNCNGYENTASADFLGVGSGICMVGSSYNTVENCVAYNNFGSASFVGVGCGISLFMSNDNNVIGCICYGNSGAADEFFAGDGIFLFGGCEGNIIDTCELYYHTSTDIDFFSCGINIFEGCSGNTVQNCDLHDNDYGIATQYSGSLNIANCYIYDNTKSGIVDDVSPGLSISGCEVYDNTRSGISLSKPNHILRDNEMYGNGWNLVVGGGTQSVNNWHQDIDTSNTVNGKPVYYLVDEQDVVIDGLTEDVGVIYLVGCDNIEVRNVETSPNNRVCILLVGTTNSLITDCDLSQAEYGIRVYFGSHNNQIVNSNCFDNAQGIRLQGGPYLDANAPTLNEIINCNLYGNSEFGFWTQVSRNTSIIGCNVYDNGYGYSEPWGQGYPGSLQYGGPGIMIHFRSEGNIIEDCTIYHNYEGIFIYHSCNEQTIRNCEIYDSIDYGPECEESGHGIAIAFDTTGCLIEECDIYNNRFGIATLDSSVENNLIYHNNVANSIQQNAYDEGINIWDDGYPSGGNYWSDYTGVDADYDGIGDTPYSIFGGSNQDNYPLMTPLDDNPPDKPDKPSGPKISKSNILCTFTTQTQDPDGDQVYYMWDWGDGTTSDWLGPYDSGEEVSAEHAWTSWGKYSVRVKAKDVLGFEGPWSKKRTIMILPDVVPDKVVGGDITMPPILPE